MPKSTNTMPFSVKPITFHTLERAILRLERYGEIFRVLYIDQRMPHATTAKMPLTPMISDTRNVTKGIETSKSTWNVVLSRPRSRTFDDMNKNSTARKMPNAMPPTKLTAKEAVASARENAPVTAAAIANWNETTPEASFKSASPCRMAPSRLPSCASLRND